ncbi:hypothetical protein ACIRSS_23745 [Amycolatopsis sp. NPDC101161]|uniref:hypothetical protein n=1 Tax=Amycolatopsis sp. NPDC101161 TaxID=3363940 RepID=UPI00382B5755
MQRPGGVGDEVARGADVDVAAEVVAYPAQQHAVGLHVPGVADQLVVERKGYA